MDRSSSTISRRRIRWWQYLLLVLAVIVAIPIAAGFWVRHQQDVTLRAALAKTDSMIVELLRRREIVQDGESRFYRETYKLNPEHSKALGQLLRDRSFGASYRLYASRPLLGIMLLDDQGKQCGEIIVYVSKSGSRQVCQSMEAIAESGEVLTDDLQDEAGPESPFMYRYINQ